MTVIPVATTNLIDETDHAVKLARYAQLIGLSEDQFFGLNNSTTASEVACDKVWTHAQRVMVAKYLGEAQEEIEQVAGYPLYPKWFVNEQHYYRYPVHTDWGKVIDAGYRHAQPIATGVAVSYVTDPSVVVTATTVTDDDEIRVFHPGTEIEVIPSSITIAGGNVTIQIPRARLVKSAYLDNPADGWAYADVPPSVTSPFESTVDVYRVHNNTDIQGGLVWSHKASACCASGCNCCPTCAEYTETACIYVRNYETGALDILPATYSAGGWTSALCSSCYCQDPDIVRINYRAGLTELTMQAEDAIVRLAHSKMPSPPCGCSIVQEMWTRDRNVPPTVTSERLNNPFGQSDGSFFAWRQALAMRIQKGMAVG